MTQALSHPEKLIDQIKTETGRSKFIGLATMLRRCFKGVTQRGFSERVSFSGYQAEETLAAVKKINVRDREYLDWLQVNGTNLAENLVNWVLDEIAKGSTEAEAAFTVLLLVDSSAARLAPPEEE